MVAKSLVFVTLKAECVVKMSALLAKRSGELVKGFGEVVKRSGEVTKRSGKIAKGSGEVAKRSGKIAKGSGEVAKRQSTRLCKPGSINTILPQDRWSRNTLYKKRKNRLVKNLVIKKRQMLYCCY